MSLIIGLTGGISSGKSTVSRMFKQLGVEVVDADIVARLVVEKGQPALADIEAKFGAGILKDGVLDRTKLRGIIFADESKKRWLNALLHPIIREEMLKQLADASGDYVLLEAPLLFENRLEAYCDHVLVIDSDETLQIQRVTARDNCSVDQAKAIISSQVSRQERLDKASFVIDNSLLSLTQLENSVIALDKRLRTLQ